MPYTLMKGLGWFALALVLGIVIGWLLRSVVAKRQVTRARNHHVDSVEMERLRGRVANLEPIVAERDQLRQELEAAVRVRGGAKGDAMVPPPRFNTVADGLAPAAAVADAPADAPDLSIGAAVLGRAIELDDLQVVEGIGPKIAELCNGIGIRTWGDLAATEASLLRTMLADAGSRFRTHDPATWPEQARLLAEGRWGEFKALVDSLDGGRATAVDADAAAPE